jgi:maltooligosyltrehalose trehalohydrolase
MDSASVTETLGFETIGKRQGAWFLPEGEVEWRIWAPVHSQVQLILWNGGERRQVEMQSVGEGYFEHREAISPDARNELRYAYRLPNVDLDLPDPASRWQPEGVHRPSAVFDPSTYAWGDRTWPRVQQNDLAIYELHVGTFTAEGTFDGVASRLRQLAHLGVTAIEIMPISQFPGTRNWGYDGVHPYAVQNSYGGPRRLQKLVDAAHQHGLCVILDVVYNHLGPEGNYLGLFGPYFTDRYQTPWGKALNFDGSDSDHVRRFVIESACQWVRDFHIDGLRLDAVQTIYDLSAYHLLQEIQDSVQATAAECGRSAVVIAETNQNDVRIVNRAERGGYGLDGMWSDDFHHSVHSVLTGETEGYYMDFGEPKHVVKALNEVFVYNGCYSPFHRRRLGNGADNSPREQFVVCIQNHDQVGNRVRGERLGGLLSLEAQRLAAALMLLSPCTPLLFMGEEYGEAKPFPFFCSFQDRGLIEAVRKGRKREFAALAIRWGGEVPDPQDPTTFEQAKLTWQWPEGTTQAGLRRLYRHLLHARRTWPALKDREHTAARLSDRHPEVLLLRRGPTPGITAWVNLSNRPIEVPEMQFDELEVILSTAEVQFGGTRNSVAEIKVLQPYELVIRGDKAWQTLPS